MVSLFYFDFLRCFLYSSHKKSRVSNDWFIFLIHVYVPFKKINR